MKGSEKQVKWAEEIRERIVAILDETIEMQQKTNPGNAANLAGFTGMRKIVAEYDGYAGNMISVFGDLRRTGDIRKDAMSVVMTARAARVLTTAGDLGQQLVALFK